MLNLFVLCEALLEVGTQLKERVMVLILDMAHVRKITGFVCYKEMHICYCCRSK